jgi:hypothetical protein
MINVILKCTNLKNAFHGKRFLSSLWWDYIMEEEAMEYRIQKMETLWYKHWAEIKCNQKG